MPATPAWPPKSAPRLFVEAPIAVGQAISIGGNQAHYLAKVMRVALGSSVILCDDLTGEWACTISEVGKHRVVLHPTRRLRPRESVPDFWLCPALLKKDRFDLVLEKASELGVAEIRPLVTRRCVANKLNAERAKAIVIEAAEQCARTVLPALAAPAKLEALLHDWPTDRALYFADELGGEPAAAAFAGFPRRQGPQAEERQAERGFRLRRDAVKAALLTGPEGGFDEAERAAIRALPQAVPITLGPRILRGETAAIAATALWMGIAGDWNNSLARG